jgi:hypothetical protein
MYKPLAMVVTMEQENTQVMMIVVTSANSLKQFYTCGCPCQGHRYHHIHYSGCHWVVCQKQGYCPLWSFLASLLSLLLGLHLRWHLPLLKNSKIGVSPYSVQQGPSSQQAMCQSEQPIQCSQMIH